MKVTYTKDDEAPRVELDPHDTWNVDRTLACIIVPLLKQLQETKHGSPYVENCDVPEELHGPEVLDYSDTDINYHTRWDWVLNEMIWAFEQHADEDDIAQFCHNGDNLKMIRKELPDGGCTVTFGKKDESKPAYFRDQEAIDAHEKRKERGRYLFAKYYNALWD